MAYDQSGYRIVENLLSDAEISSTAEVKLNRLLRACHQAILEGHTELASQAARATVDTARTWSPRKGSTVSFSLAREAVEFSSAGLFAEAAELMLEAFRMQDGDTYYRRRRRINRSVPPSKETCGFEFFSHRRRSYEYMESPSLERMFQEILGALRTNRQFLTGANLLRRRVEQVERFDDPDPAALGTERAQLAAFLLSAAGEIRDSNPADSSAIRSLLFESNCEFRQGVKEVGSFCGYDSDAYRELALGRRLALQESRFEFKDLDVQVSRHKDTGRE
ncbi:MAG: hypothetical protein AB7W16_26005 [Candidatus Obscuribacterales bacterium]